MMQAILEIMCAHGAIKAEPAGKSNQREPLAPACQRFGAGLAFHHSGRRARVVEVEMAKGQMRSNKEPKKPKKDKLAAAKPVTGLGAGSAGNTAKK